MRVERLSTNQFTIFLTFDDLVERGLTSDEVWHDAANVGELFSEMVDEASDELDLELDGTLLVQVYLMQSQGMHITVTQSDEWPYSDDEDFIEMKVTLDESDELIFVFDDFEDVIKVTTYLIPLDVETGEVYFFEDRYYVMFDEQEVTLHKEEIIAIMSEYANSSIVSSHRLRDYGKVIYKKNAIKEITKHFHTN